MYISCVVTWLHSATADGQVHFIFKYILTLYFIGSVVSSVF